MTLGDSVATCFRKYFDFNGRASRGEYWWFFVFALPVYLASFAMTAATHTRVFIVLVILALFFPLTAAAVRRLHDTGRSGWWWFTVLIPTVGEVVLIVLLAQPTQPLDNRYGRYDGAQMPSAPTP